MKANLNGAMDPKMCGETTGRKANQMVEKEKIAFAFRLVSILDGLIFLAVKSVLLYASTMPNAFCDLVHNLRLAKSIYFSSVLFCKKSLNHDDA